jgi:lysophospholipase L1-like esterase
VNHLNRIDIVLNAIVILTLVSLETSPLWIPVVFEYELAEELTPEPSATPTSTPTPTPTPPPPTNETIRIMPLGDSITQGDSNGGYRQKLYLDLTDAGFSIDFVGSLSSPSSPNPSFDTDHEGHSGWHANQIEDNVYQWLVNNPTDIVLLHIGTNDITYGDQNVSEVEGILDEIDRYEINYNQSVTVLLARIILRTDNLVLNETTKDFNNAVVVMAQTRIANGDDIIIVDMENALTYPDDMNDGEHPNAVGYEKMADTWLGALLPILTPA